MTDGTVDATEGDPAAPVVNEGEGAPVSLADLHRLAYDALNGYADLAWIRALLRSGCASPEFLAGLAERFVPTLPAKTMPLRLALVSRGRGTVRGEVSPGERAARRLRRLNAKAHLEVSRLAGQSIEAAVADVVAHEGMSRTTVFQLDRDIQAEWASPPPAPTTATPSRSLGKSARRGGKPD